MWMCVHGLHTQSTAGVLDCRFGVTRFTDIPDSGVDGSLVGVVYRVDGWAQTMPGAHLTRLL